ncbi:MAG TPA: hypothetical protein PKD63_12220, partial [Solirubrobacteraceae bacterium]|nr:hypothetical protein [Solirubrobacteraceae bacterium]
MPSPTEPKKSVIAEKQSASYKRREKAREIGNRILKVLLKDPLAWFLLAAAVAGRILPVVGWARLAMTAPPDRHDNAFPPFGAIMG